MQIYLPIAEISVPAETIFCVSVFVGLMAGMFGIGGGFLTTPFMIFLGIPPAVAVGTQPCQIVASGMAGMLLHLRKGHVDFKMGSVMLIGGFVGTIVGTFIFKLLDYAGQIDFAISVLYAILLGTIGLMMLGESFFKLMKSRKSIEGVTAEFNNFKVNNFKSALPFKIRFPRSNLYISAILPISIGFVGGILGSVLGIGGGFMIVPAMIYILGMPGLIVVGTSLFQIMITTAMATLMHAIFNHTVDILLAVILISGGVIGTQIGVVLARHIQTTHARFLFALIIIGVSLRLSAQLFIEPSELFSTVVR